MTDFHDVYEAPLSGRVSFEDVAERIETHDLGDTPEAMRAGFSRLLRGAAAGTPLPFAAPATWGGIDGLVAAPPGVDGEARVRVVWFHGGGYVFGAPETHARAAAVLASKLGEPVFLPRYRLAPEHPWPAQLDDALAVVGALRKTGAVALVGDSAGGHLALVTALALARDGTPPAALALLSPNTDRTGLSDTREVNTPRDPMNADDDDRELAAMAFGDRPDDDPEVSPVLADLALLPPTHVEVGGREVLLGDARILARRGRAAGADVALHVEPEAFHMWQLWAPWLPEADASLDRVAALLRSSPPA